MPNVYNILLHDPEWKGVIGYNEHAACVVKRRLPPFGARAAHLGEWSDEDDGRLALYLATHYRIEPKDNVLLRAVRNAADAASFHPIREFLQGLRWDGSPRLEWWLRAFLRAQPCWYSAEGRALEAPAAGADPPKGAVEYTAAVGVKFLVAAVARVMEPGCKMDNVLILEGEQGRLKSSAMAALFDPWFTDQQIKIGDKDTYEVMRGQWGVELAELDALSKAEVSALKAFFSRSRDRFRLFYGRRAATVARQTVFVGTVNHYQYLRDSSGNRRYWPVRCGEMVALKDLKEERDQLWAEAFALYEKGTPWWVTSDEYVMFQAEAEKRYVGDAWEARIRLFLDGDASKQEAPRDEVTMTQLLGGALGLDASKWTQGEQIRVGVIMERLGWLTVRPRSEGGLRPRVYRRPS